MGEIGTLEKASLSMLRLSTTWFAEGAASTIRSFNTLGFVSTHVIVKHSQHTNGENDEKRRQRPWMPLVLMVKKSSVGSVRGLEVRSQVSR